MKTVSKRYNRIYITTDSLGFGYFGLIPSVEVGQKIEKCTRLGTLEHDFLVLTARKNSVKINVYPYINCKN